MSDTQVNRAVATYGKTSDINASSRYNGYALSVLGNNSRAHRTAVEIGLMQLKQLLAEGKITDDLRALARNLASHPAARHLGSIRRQQQLSELAFSRAIIRRAFKRRDRRRQQKRQDAYERARLENPTSPLPLLGLAQLDLTDGDAKSAREHLNAAIAKEI